MKSFLLLLFFAWMLGEWVAKQLCKAIRRKIVSVAQHIEQAVAAPAVNVSATSVSLATMAAAFLEKIHGPAATIGVILGAVWVALQIYLAVEKRWLRKGK